jgi:hypothetical protein
MVAIDYDTFELGLDGRSSYRANITALLQVYSRLCRSNRRGCGRVAD